MTDSPTIADGVFEKRDSFMKMDKISLLGGNIVLNPTVSKLNFFSFLLSAVFLGVVLLPISLLQSSLLTKVYGLSPTGKDDILTLVQIFQAIVQFIAAPLFGYLCDRYGRKGIMTFGVIGTSIAIILMPLLPEAYPYYLLLQLFNGIAFIAMTAPPLLADYIDYKTKGRVAGLLFSLINLGSFLITLGIRNMSPNSDIPLKFYIIGGIGCFLGLLVLFGIKGGTYHKHFNFDLIAAQEEAEKAQTKNVYPLQKSEEENTVVGQNNNLTVNEPLIQKAEEIDIPSEEERNGHIPQVTQKKPSIISGFKEAKNPWVLIGYICSFLATANTSLTGVILVNYVTYTTNQSNTEQAYTLASVQQITTVLICIVFGFFTDTYNKFKILIFIIFTSVVGSGLVILSPTPDHPMAYAAMICLGISIGGFLTFVTQVLSVHSNPAYRASVMAVSGISYGLGIAAISIIGLYLQKHDTLLPYELYIVFAFIGFLATLFIYVAKKGVINKG